MADERKSEEVPAQAEDDFSEQYEDGAEFDDQEVVGVFDADDTEGLQAAMDQMMAEQEAAHAGERDEELVDVSRIQMVEHEDSAYCVAISPAEPIAVSGDGDDSWVLWDLRDGEVIAKNKAHADTIIDVGFNFNGKLFATGAMDKTVKVWVTATQALKCTLEGPEEDIQCVAWHPKGNLIAAGSDDCTVWLWDAASGNPVHVLAGHTGPVLCADWTPSGKLLVTSGADGSTRIWSGKTGECVHVFEGHGWHEMGCVSQAVHATKPLIMVGGEDGTARMANIQTKKALGVYAHLRPQVAETGVSSSTVTAAMHAQDAAAAVAAAGGESADQAADEFEEQAGSKQEGHEEGDDEGGEGGEGGAAHVEQMNGCSVEGCSFFSGQGSEESMRWAATAATDGTLRVWDLTGADVRSALRHSILHPDALIKVVWHPAHPVLFSACADGVVRLWDARTGALVKEYTGHMNMVLDLKLVHPSTYATFEEDAAAAGAEGGQGTGKVPLSRLQIVTAGDDQVCRVFDV